MESFVKTGFLMIVGVLAFLAMPLAAQAQGIVGGAERGAADGGRAAGPVGAVIGGVAGGVIGGVVGGVTGVLGVPQYRYQAYYYPHPRYRHHRRYHR